MTDIAGLRIKTAHRDEVLAVLNQANIEVVEIDEHKDGEARISIPSYAASYEFLSSIPSEWWAIRGVVQ